MLTLEFWPHPFKIHIWYDLAPSLFQTLEFWPSFYKLWIYLALVLQTWLEFWLYVYKHWNSGPILSNFEIQVLFI